ELTDWIQAHPDQAQKLLISELKEEIKADLAQEPVAHAWKRIKFTNDVSPELIAKAVQDGKDAGFLKGSTDTSKLLESPLCFATGPFRSRRSCSLSRRANSPSRTFRKLFK